jgi:hypothetical protein
MQDEKRRDEAQVAAEVYAPRPVSSPLMYGIVGASLAALVVAAFAGFYDLDPLAYPFSVLSGVVVAFIGALVLRRVRLRQHDFAHRREYNKTRLR